MDSHPSITLISEVLRTEDDFLVSAHVRADGDAIAAVCAMSLVLDQMGKRFVVVLHDAVPDSRYAFLSGFDSIRSIRDGALPFPPRTAILLDTPNTDRLGAVTRLMRQCRQTITIDHHPPSGGFGGIEFIDTSASSTCELLAGLVKNLPVRLTPELAETIYTGILFDTGQFRFSNTGARTLAVASAMIDAGAEPENITERLFYRWSLLKARTMGHLLLDMTLHAQDKIAVLPLTHDFFLKNPGGYQALEGLSDLGITLETVKVSAFLKELEPNHFRVSLRATEHYDVGRVAMFFGGGGHAKAAGCAVHGDLETVRARVVDALKKLSGIQ